MDPADFSTIGQRIRSLLFKRDARKNAASSAAGAAEATEPSSALDPEEFADKLRTIARDHGQLAVGKLQILGFQAIQERLGDRWPQLQDRIPQVIEAVFRRRLTARDVFRPYKELVYLVIFAELSAEEARVKAHFIVEEIWQQLFGMGERDEKIDVSMLTINLETSQVEEVADLDTLLAQHFEKAAIDAAAQHEAFEAEPLPGPSAPAPPSPARPEPGAASQTYLSYTPLWMVSRAAVSTYYARMCLISGPKNATYGHDILRRASAPRDIYDFDLATLARVQASVLRLGKSRAPAVLVCPVHYTTLINREARREYLRLCAELPRFAARHLILEVGGLAAGFPPHNAFEIHHWIKSYCRAAWALVPPSPAAVQNLKDAGFAAVGFDARYLGHLRRLATVAPQFAETAHRHRMRPYAHGLTLPETVVAAADAGFDFLSGDAIRRPVARIHAPYRLTLEDIIAESR